jgi:hypothetical protein
VVTVRTQILEFVTCRPSLSEAGGGVTFNATEDKL